MAAFRLVQLGERVRGDDGDRLRAEGLGHRVIAHRSFAEHEYHVPSIGAAVPAGCSGACIKSDEDDFLTTLILRGMHHSPCNPRKLEYLHDYPIWGGKLNGSEAFGG